MDVGEETELIGKNEMKVGKKEAVEEKEKGGGRKLEGSEDRGVAKKDVEDLAKFSGVTVWNGVKEDWHHTQMVG
ncbi:ornithine carbamoyltransferase, partial [Staphylococcus aureus]